MAGPPSFESAFSLVRNRFIARQLKAQEAGGDSRGATALPWRPERRGVWGAPGAPQLHVEKLDRLFVDFHVLAVGDGRRLRCAHEMAPAPWQPRGVELLERRLMVL